MILDGGKGVLAQGPLLSSLVFLSASSLVPHLVDLSPGETHNMASPHTSEKPTKEATVFYDLISEVTCHHHLVEKVWHGAKSTDAKVHCLSLNPGHAISSCVTLDRLLNLSGPQFHGL